MSDAIKTIHTLLVTLSAAELCEVITRSAELCAGLAKKKPSVARVAPVAPVASVASVTAPKPSKPSVVRAAPVAKPAVMSVAPVAKEEPVEPVAKEEPNIPKTFAALLGWSDSEEDDLLQHSNRAYDSSDEFREDSESNADSVDAEPTLSPAKKCRDMTKCFTHGQRIRHTVSDKVRMGTYDSAKNAIVHNGIAYSTLTKFATAHVLAEYNPNRATTRDGWKHCKCEVKGKWVSTYNLP